MKVTIQRKPIMTGRLFGKAKEHPTEKYIYLSVIFTEEEKEIIKRGLMETYFEFPENTVSEGGSRNFPFFLFFNPDYQNEDGFFFPFYPRNQNEMSYMNTEKAVENMLRTLSDMIKNLQQHPTGKKELDL